MSYKPTDILTTEQQIRDIVDDIHDAQKLKILDHIDQHCQAWIERSPSLVMSTVNSAGQLDASPKGDPAGFVKVIDRQTLAIPDRPGNHRFDSFRYILGTGRIGLVFMVPNRNEMVRVNGRAQIVRDVDLREKWPSRDGYRTLRLSCMWKKHSIIAERSLSDPGFGPRIRPRQPTGCQPMQRRFMIRRTDNWTRTRWKTGCNTMTRTVFMMSKPISSCKHISQLPPPLSQTNNIPLLHG